MKSIKELAEELGVTKAALQKRIARPPLNDNIKPHLNKGNKGAFLVDKTGESIIKAYYAENVPRIQSGAENVPRGADSKDETIKSLLALTAEQQKTIQDLTATVENMSQSLKAAQALHVNTVKQALEAKEETPESEQQKKPSLFARFFGS